MEQRLRIRIRGASPYGFRLVGGRGQPISVTKLRARSKAAEAGLKEGDEISSVNGYSCKDVSYERLIGLVEHAGHYLDLDIIRHGPGAVSRHRKWSYDRMLLDDVIASPTTTSYDDSRRYMSSSPQIDYDNVFALLADVGAQFSTDSVFEGPPTRPPLEDLRRQPAVRARRPWEKTTHSDIDKVSVVTNADQSITMSLAMPTVDSK